ncbi:MAG: NADH:ubiquinone oxidoreductase [Deltaproteobacteria bacterium]|nr:NADH:ubiquinone oxidoreductase [Deltaproteobacteria bacterium]
MKPKIAFFDFAGCEGCQLQVVNLEDEMLDLLGAVEIVQFREAMSERGEDYAVAFVEGSITREKDIPRLKKIRERAALLVALGSCAATGGVNGLKNFHPLPEVRRSVYGEKADWYETAAARPLQAVVAVDACVYGCPIHKDDFLRVVKALLLGKKPETPTYPICVECKRAGHLCVFELGSTCLGPVTRAGCGAWCPAHREGCQGCRGLVPDPNTNAEKEVLQKHGLSMEQALGQFRLFLGYAEVAP